MRTVMMKTCSYLLICLALVSAGLTSCASDEPKRKKVVGPDGSAYSNLPWNRPKAWESNARFGGMMPQSR
jgi:hypothetical protein